MKKRIMSYFSIFFIMLSLFSYQSLNFVFGKTIQYPKEKGAFLYWSSAYNSGNRTLIETSTVDMLISKGINTIYLSGFSASTWDYPEKFTYFKNFIAYAKSQNVVVYGMIFEDPSFVVKTDEFIQTRMQDILLKTGNLGISGYVTDVEVHTISSLYPQYPSFYLDEATTKYYLDNYMRIHQVMYDTIQSANKKLGFAFCCPYWYQSRLITAGYSNGLDSVPSNFVNTMIYTTTASSMLSRLNTIIDIEKPIVVSINIKNSGDPYFSPSEFELAKVILHNLYGEKEILGYSIYETKTLLELVY